METARSLNEIFNKSSTMRTCRSDLSRSKSGGQIIIMVFCIPGCHSLTNWPNKSRDYRWARSDIGYPYPIINTSKEDADFNWDWLSGANMKYHNAGEQEPAPVLSASSIGWVIINEMGVVGRGIHFQEHSNLLMAMNLQVIGYVITRLRR